MISITHKICLIPQMICENLLSFVALSDIFVFGLLLKKKKLNFQKNVQSN